MLFDIRYEIKKFTEKITIKIVWALPKNVVMWSYLRVLANATSGKYSSHPDDLAWNEVLERWEIPNEYKSYKVIDGKWWEFINGEKSKMLNDNESAAVIWSAPPAEVEVNISGEIPSS